MKKFFFCVAIILFAFIGLKAHPINSYKYIIIENQDDAAKDIEPRLFDEFQKMGFILLSDDLYQGLDEAEKAKVLTAKYRCRQSGECIFKLELVNQSGEEVYEDEQIFGGGFMTRKNDRQGAIKRIFKELKKLNYQFEP